MLFHSEAFPLQNGPRPRSTGSTRFIIFSGRAVDSSRTPHGLVARLDLQLTRCGLDMASGHCFS